MEAIIFDMDGLMIDSERLYIQAEEEIAGKFGKKLKEETLWKMMGRKPEEGIEIFVKDLQIPAEPGHILEMRTQLMREKLKNDLLPMPGLEIIIAAFENRLHLAICTGASREFLDITLDSLGIRDKFSVLQSSDEINKGKPDPEIYLAACDKLGCPPSRCIVLEDSSNGALSGKRAGCYVIAIPTTYTVRQDFSFVDYIASDLLAAADHIRSMPGRMRIKNEA